MLALIVCSLLVSPLQRRVVARQTAAFNQQVTKKRQRSRAPESSNSLPLVVNCSNCHRGDCSYQLQRFASRGYNSYVEKQLHISGAVVSVPKSAEAHLSGSGNQEFVPAV